ncbi:glycosyltransferase [Arcanobacterium haemolyticum]|nr:glycosyltransferase [Arcanobacterium haemolyticum]
MSHEDTAARESVVALLLSTPDDSRLERVIDGLLTQKVAPSRIVLALRGDDTQLKLGASQREKLDELDCSVHSVPEGTTMSDAVNLLIRRPHGSQAEEPTEQWIWLIHGDTYPRPDALDHLLRAGETSAKVGAVGPKQVDWDNPRILREVGIRATRSARRVPHVAEDELDQGQLDWQEDVLAVGSAGMLLRRAALDAIGELDPVLGPFGDGLETSRRLWAGGWRVVVAPSAVIEHARDSFADQRRSFGARRGAQIYNAALAASVPLLAVLALLLVAPLRAFVRLITKETRLAAGELAGAGFLVRRLGALTRARRRFKRAQSVPSSVLRSLESTPSEVRKAKRDLARQAREKDGAGERRDPIAEREYRRWRSRTARAGYTAITVALLVAIAASLPVVGRGVLTGNALLPDSWTSAELLQAATNWWLPAGDGLPAPVDALWIMLTPVVALAELVGGNLGSVASAIVLLGLPLSALTAFLAAGRLTSSPVMRGASALVWAFVPSLLVSVSSGHVAGIVWHIFAPVALASLAECWKRRSSTALGLASLSLAFMSAAAPVTLVLALLVTAVGCVARRPRLRWLWVPVPALVFLAPALWHVRLIDGGWRVVAATAGIPTTTQPSFVGILTLNPTSGASLRSLIASPTALIPALGVGALVLVAVVALLHKHNWVAIRLGFFLVAGGIAWAGVARTIVVGSRTVGAQSVPATGWAGIGLSLAALGLWLVLICAGDGLAARLSRHSFGLVHVTSGLGALLVVFSLVATTLPWIGTMLSERPLSAASQSRVPAVAALDQESDARVRVLALAPTDDGIVAQIWRGDGPELHEQSMLSQFVSDRADDDLRALVADLTIGEQAREALAAHAVAYVLVPPADSTISQQARLSLVSELRAHSDLEFVSDTETGAFWRVQGAPIGRATLDETVLNSSLLNARISLPATDRGGQLALAERSDPGWRATLNGQELEATANGWSTSWEVPAGGGNLVVSREPSEKWSGFVAGFVSAIAIVMSLPLRRKQVRE